VQDAAHVLGNFFKVLVAVIIFGFSIVLEYSFFASISPPDKAAWFPFLALGLTAGGFVGWMFSFRLIKHHPLHTIIALLMMIGCALASLIVAGTEFYSWIAEHYNITTNPQMFQNVTTMLLVVFCAHVVALLVDVSTGHFARNPFRNPGPGQYIPQYAPQGYYQQGYLPAAGGGESAYPLLPRQRNQRNQRNRVQPKEAEMSLEDQEEIEQPPVQSPVKQPPPLQMHEGDSLLDVFKDGLTSLLPQRK
jgi:hypothetical protein